MCYNQFVMIIVASNNLGKIREFKEILDGFDLTSLKENNIEIDIKETGSTYLENAYIKATTIHDLTNEICMGDDSGIEILGLNNFPGIFSARYASNYDDPCEVILDKMKDLKDRRARFVCSIVLIDKDGTRYSGEGICNGTISFKKKGNNGFGYDPIFVPEGFDKTLGELDEETKNTLSHRYKALLDLKSKLPVRFLRRNKRND